MSKMLYYVGCVIVSILIFNVSAKSVKTRDIDNEPKCCCWTNKFSAEGNIVILPMSGSGLSATENRHITGSFAYDGENGLMGMKGVYKNSTDHEIESFWMISDIRNGHVYRIDEKSQACSSDSSIVTPTVCIPETARHLGSHTTQLNNKDIITDSWIYKLTEDKNNELSVYTIVTRDDFCFPVYTKIDVYDTESNERSYLSWSVIQTMAKIVPEIQDKSIIKIPDQCLTHQ